MSSDPKHLQLEILQTRIGLHGSRMWQLPLTYLTYVGAVGAVAANAETHIPFSVKYLFVALFLLGCVISWALYGAAEGYSRTANNMNSLERELGLSEFTKAKLSHILPYYFLMALGMISCIFAYFLVP